MKLTFDTLLDVISFSCYAKDAVQLMATCRVLYHEGPKIALKKPVIISTRKQLAAFLKFLHADDSFRCQYLRQLELRVWSWEPDVVQELVATVPLLTNIEFLRLVGADQLLRLHPDLTSAFGSLSTLRHIDFTGVKGLTCALLSSLHCPVVSASIDFVSSGGWGFWDDLELEEWAKHHPATLLGNFVATLEELRCVGWRAIEECPLDTPADGVFLNMRKLSIELHEDLLRIYPLIYAFPNLTHLRVRNKTPRDRALEDILCTHQTNIAPQLDTVHPSGTWGHLEYFEGCFTDLYAFGLTCRIPRLTLLDTWHDDSGIEMLTTMLQYTRPVHLKFPGIAGVMLGDADRPGFISFLRGASASNLTDLDICVCIGEDEQEKDLGPVIDDLVSALIGLPLKSLEMRLECSDLDSDSDSDSDPEVPPNSDFESTLGSRNGLSEPKSPETVPAPLTTAELSLQALDTDALIDRLESIPSLEVAHVTVLPFPHHRDEHDWTSCERTITRGESRLVGDEHWPRRIPGNN